MFFTNLIDHKVTHHIYCVLFTLLLVTSNVLAEDIIVDPDPNRNFVFGLLHNLWDFLTGLFA